MNKLNRWVHERHQKFAAWFLLNFGKDHLWLARMSVVIISLLIFLLLMVQNYVFISDKFRFVGNIEHPNPQIGILILIMIVMGFLFVEGHEKLEKEPGKFLLMKQLSYQYAQAVLLIAGISAIFFVVVLVLTIVLMIKSALAQEQQVLLLGGIAAVISLLSIATLVAIINFFYFLSCFPKDENGLIENN